MQHLSITQFLVLFIGLCLPSLSFSQTENLHLTIDSAQVQQGQEFCLDVRVENFDQLIGLQFGLQWQPEVLRFTSSGNLNLSALPLSDNNFGLAQAEAGQVRFSWFDPLVPENGISLSDDALLFQLCFEAVGAEGSASAIQFTENVLEAEVTFPDFSTSDFMHTDGIVQIGEGDFNPGDLPVLLKMGNITAPAESIACLNVFTENFDSLVSLQYALEWDASVAEFVEAQNLSLPGLTENDFQLTEAGLLNINWQSEVPSGVTLFPQNVPYSLCFQLIGEPNEATLVRLQGNPIAFNVTGDTIEVQVESGNIRVEPTGTGGIGQVEFFIPDVTAAPNDLVCVPVQAVGFETVLSTQYSLAWDADVLQFETIQGFNLPALVTSDFNVQNAANGSLSLSWLDPMLEGVTLQDSAAMYEVCFEAIGNIGESTLLEFVETPTPMEVVQLLGNQDTVFAATTSNGTIRIGERGTFVLPGDTDTDDYINHYDLLNIGLGFGQNGPLRPSASIDPTAQLAEDWANSTPETAINFKHADTNGDGIIDEADTLALVQNWGFEPNFFTTIIAEDELEVIDGRSDKPPFFVLPDTLQPGATYELPVILGSADNPAEAVYGLAFSLQFDTAVIVPGSVRMSFEESWLGADLLTVQKEFSEAGRLDVAITRTDGMDVSGSGMIGKLHLTIEDVIFFDDNHVDDRSGEGEYELRFEIENVRLISANEIEQEVTTTESISLIETEVTSVAPIIRHEGLTIYPNPVQDVLHIQVEQGSVKTIRVLDSMGKVVQTLPASTQLSVRPLRTGQYTLQVVTEKQVIVTQFIVVH